MRLRFVLWVFVLVLVFLQSCRHSEQESVPESQPVHVDNDAEDPLAALGADAGCYVCHMIFVEEKLSVVHREAKVGCTKCHGISAGHANDENIGATRPDVVFKNDEINLFCRTCHETHDVDPEKVVARLLGRTQGKAATQPAERTVTCTQCHGEHRIDG